MDRVVRCHDAILLKRLTKVLVGSGERGESKGADPSGLEAKGGRKEEGTLEKVWVKEKVD